MTLRVIQWATGNVGRCAVEGVLAHPELELVGAWVHSSAKVGRDVGEICGLPPIGVSATDDVDTLLGLGADCVVYSPILGRPDEVIRILKAGINVVTPLGWFYPFHSAGYEEVESAAHEGGVSIHGTGIHPGGITERFPLMVSAMATNIRHVRAEEWSDIRNYRAEGVVKEVMLFGKPPEVAAKSPMLQVLGHGFKQSIDMVAAALGWQLDAEKPATHEMSVATAPIETPVGVLEPGTVAGQRFTWRGTVGGETVMTVRTNWLMGEASLDPAWRLDGERFEVALDADPPVELHFHGLHPGEVGSELDRLPGILATAMHCVNAVPAVCRAEPGIRTYLDLPLIHGRAAARG